MEVPSYRLFKEKVSEIEQTNTATQAALELKADVSALDLKADVSALDLKADVSDLDRYMNQMMMKIGNDDLGMFKDNATLIYVPPIDATGCTTLLRFFSGCEKLRTVPFIRTTNVTSMFCMFYGCTNLTSIPAMDTSSVTNMYNMFRNCTSLTSVPALDTSSVTDMARMFDGCTKLASIPLMDTSSVRTMQYMLNACRKLTSIPLMDTSSVTDMSYMFARCSSLTTIPLLDISNVTVVLYMFYECSSLTSVTFQCDDVRKYSPTMFYGTPIESGNGTIYVPDNLVDAYKTAEGWSALASLIHGISEKPKERVKTIYQTSSKTPFTSLFITILLNAEPHNSLCTSLDLLIACILLFYPTS